MKRISNAEAAQSRISLLGVLAGFLLVGCGWLLAQQLSIDGIRLRPNDRPEITFAGTNGYYYILREGDTVTNVVGASDVVLGTNAIGTLLGRTVSANTTRFFRVEARDIGQSGDLDRDGLLDVYELRYPAILHPLIATDALADPDLDGCNNLCEATQGSDPQKADQLTRLETSPAAGESGVAVTRETLVRFTQPLAAGSTLNNDRLFATAAGRRILSRVELSGDRRTATLFYLENLPSSSRVRVTLLGDLLRDTANQAPDADGDGQPGGTLELDFDTLTTTPVAGTAIRGRVFASELQGTNAINRPLERVTVTVDGAEESIRTTTDADGNFVLRNCPAGRFFVHVDGRTAVGSQWPDGAYYPYVGKAWEAAAGRDDNLAGDEPHAQRTGNIYLPLIPADALKTVSSTEPTVVTFPSSVLATHPELAGVELRVPPNSLFTDNGTRGGRVGIAPVPPDRLPGALPGGLQFPIVITVQTDGPSNFDQPVPICFPNLPDPGLGVPLKPGEKNYLYSFNHDVGEWQAVGSMTVSADGKTICTDPGVGILQPGWHGTGPAPLPPDCLNCCPARPAVVPLKLANAPPPAWSAPVSATARRGGARPSAEDSSGGKCGTCPQGTYQNCLNNCDTQAAACLMAVSISTKLCLDQVAHKRLVGGASAEEVGNLLADCLMQEQEGKEACEEARKTCMAGCQGCPVGQSRAQPQSDPAPFPPPWFQEFLDQVDSIRSSIASLIAQGKEVPVEQLIALQAVSGEFEKRYGQALDAAMLAELLRLQKLQAEQESIAGADPGNAPPYPVLISATALTRSGKQTFRTQTDANGHYQLFVPRNTSLVFASFYDPAADAFGSTFSRLDHPSYLPRFSLSPISSQASDRDGDQLADIVEEVLGTSDTNPDSDSDGIPDGVEVRTGTNPLDGRPVATGVIASQPLPGNAIDVCAFDNRAIVALGDAGVGVLNVFNGLTPTLVAQVDTAGTAHQVACAGNLVAVADGPAGVALIDITQPAEAALVRQVPVQQLSGGETRSVATAADLVFAGQSTGFLFVIEASSGIVIQRVELGGSVDSLAVEGVTLYAMAAGRLWVLPFASGILERRGSVGATHGRLFVGNARAYIASGAGFRVYDVSNPEAPVAVGQESTTQMNWKQLVPTGSGYGLGVVGINLGEDSADDVYLYDLRNGANTFVTRLETPGVAKAVSIFNGLGYLADGSAGLQILNFIPYDSRKQPPVGQLVLSATNSAIAGSFVVVRAEVQDDVQVRNVEFLLDGNKLATDGNFPFEVVYRVPTNRIGQSLNFTARVVDTGGNAASLTNLAAVPVVPDELPPVVQVDGPLANSRFFDGDVIPVTVGVFDNVGVASVSILVDGVTVAAQRVGGIDYLVTARIPRGAQVLQVRAVDNSGRSAESAGVPFAIWLQAISREYSVFNFGTQDNKPQAISREYSVFNFGTLDNQPQAVSREYSVFNFGTVDDKPQAISREYSVFNFGTPDDKPQAVSREYSVEVPRQGEPQAPTEQRANNDP